MRICPIDNNRPPSACQSRSSAAPKSPTMSRAASCPAKSPPSASSMKLPVDVAPSLQRYGYRRHCVTSYLHLRRECSPKSSDFRSRSVRVSRVVIKNYRALREVDVALEGPTTLVIGENNTGQIVLYLCATALSRCRSSFESARPHEGRRVLRHRPDKTVPGLCWC